MKYPIKNIIVGDRQRKDMGDISELADSLKRLGQIHSIGVHSDGKLIWGRRRMLAAIELGWEEIDATVRDNLTEADAEEIELEEDIRRKQRTWQEEVIAIARLHALKSKQARARGDSWGVRETARYVNLEKSFVAEYCFALNDGLLAVPKDLELWEAPHYSAAVDLLRDRAEKSAFEEMMQRRAAAKVAIEQAKATGVLANVVSLSPNTPLGSPILGHVQSSDLTRRLTLRERSMAYSAAFPNIVPPNSPLYYSRSGEREMLHGFWFVGGSNISDFYGSYQVEYLRRINSLFPDINGKEEVVHLFSGSIPPSEAYTVVGLPDAGNTPDIVCDAHNLSSGLGFAPSLIYADPPYSVEDSEHYADCMVNRERVLDECITVLKPGGYVVWLDQALPIFSNDKCYLVGMIGYIRSTGNRFRVISIFQKHQIKGELPLMGL